eukprot:scaffold735_cov376-Prasinococcus_capsulatus_cf.AAC.8
MAKTQEQVERQVRAKMAQRKAYLRGKRQPAAAATDAELPPRQHWSRGDKWVVIDNRTSDFDCDLARWELRVEGLAGPPATRVLDKAAIEALCGGEQLFRCHIHCVTQCSVRVAHPFRGVSLARLVRALQPRPDWTWLLQHGQVGGDAHVRMHVRVRVRMRFDACTLAAAAGWLPGAGAARGGGGGGGGAGPLPRLGAARRGRAARPAAVLRPGAASAPTRARGVGALDDAAEPLNGPCVRACVRARAGRGAAGVPAAVRMEGMQVALPPAVRRGGLLALRLLGGARCVRARADDASSSRRRVHPSIHPSIRPSVRPLPLTRPAAAGAHWRGRVDAEERFGDGDAQEGRQEAAASRSSSSSSSSIGSRWRRAWARWALWAVGVLFRWELTRPLALRLQRGIARWHNRPAASEAARKDL